MPNPYTNLTKPMEKPMIKNVLNKLGALRVAFVASVGFPLIFASNAFAQLAAPAAPAPAGEAVAERVIVTGSNIPTAEETGPNPVDTYRPQDIEKLGIRNATDLTTILPQEAGGTVNQNIANGGDGTVQINLRGLLPKETLVLIDGKRWATSSLNGGYDVQLIPFALVDHLEILKDGASAIYGADAVSGVVNYFLVHKFRGLEIGGSYGNTTWERPTRWVSGRHGSKPAPEMIRLTLWSLLISGSVPAASLAGTATFRATGISHGLAGSTPGVETNLVALEASG